MIINPYIFGSGTPPPAGKWYDALFLTGDVGNVFDFNDLSTLFQDTAHTVPVTTVGDPINSIKCKKTGYYATATSGISMVLAYDATRSLYAGKCVTLPASGNNPMLLATGAVPSALGGDSTGGLTLIGVSTFSSSDGGVPSLLGPASVGGGNAAAIGNLTGPVSSNFLQFGGGYGVTGSAPYSAVSVATGTKSTTRVMKIYDGSSLIGSNTAPAAANITVLDFNIGRIMNANDLMYSCVAISREITSTEVSTMAASALVGP